MSRICKIMVYYSTNPDDISNVTKPTRKQFSGPRSLEVARSQADGATVVCMDPELLSSSSAWTGHQNSFALFSFSVLQ